jgi:hypothetical protein
MLSLSLSLPPYISMYIPVSTSRPLPGLTRAVCLCGGGVGTRAMVWAGKEHDDAASCAVIPALPEEALDY